MSAVEAVALATGAAGISSLVGYVVGQRSSATSRLARTFDLERESNREIIRSLRQRLRNYETPPLLGGEGGTDDLLHSLGIKLAPWQKKILLPPLEKWLNDPANADKIKEMISKFIGGKAMKGGEEQEARAITEWL